MNRIFLLGALALPLALTACGTYVGVDGGYGGPGYYAYGGPGYYDGVSGDVAVYGYDRGGYHSHDHHYDGNAHHADVASHNFSHGSSNVASVSHASGGHVGGGGSVSHASASVGGGHSGGGGHGGGHR